MYSDGTRIDVPASEFFGANITAAQEAAHLRGGVRNRKVYITFLGQELSSMDSPARLLTTRNARSWR